MRKRLALGFVLIALGLNFIVASTDSTVKVAETLPVDPLGISTKKVAEIIPVDPLSLSKTV